MTRSNPGSPLRGRWQLVLAVAWALVLPPAASGCSEFDVGASGGAPSSSSSSSGLGPGGAGGGPSSSSSGGPSEPRCLDGVEDDRETDVDCGGPDCSPCADKMRCAVASDCASSRCDHGACAAPTCSDGSSNGGETDVDCGGPCDACADGLHCLSDADCASDLCRSDGTCGEPTCSNHVLDPGEADVDCGGACAPCALGAACMTSADCVIGACTASRCEAPRGVWVRVQPATPPAARFQHALAYDPQHLVTVAYGGTDGVNVLGDASVYQGQAWAQLPALPTDPFGRAAPMLVPYAGTLLMFGGYAPVSAPMFLGDTWLLDASSGAWTYLPLAPGPLGRSASQFGVTAQGPFFFGGAGSGGIVGDTWTFAGGWVQSAAPAPTARFGGALAYAPTQAYLFGGSPDGSFAFDDTWRWDGAAWSLVTTTTRPPARWLSAMVMDTTRNRAVLFGGLANGVAIAADTWEFDGATWTRTAEDGPSPRYFHAMAYDAARGRVVLFGGSYGAALGDTWEYHAVGNACAAGAECDTGGCVDRVCCETPACAPDEACNLPSSPGSCARTEGANARSR